MAVDISQKGICTPSEEKLSSLKDYFSNLEETKENAEISSFAEHLFARAPKDFLDRIHVTTMSHIASETFTFYKKYKTEKLDKLVEVKHYPSNDERREFTSIIACCEDRPFIIESLLEFFRNEEIIHHVLLHPIINEANDKSTALAYIQLERINSETKRKELERKISTLYQELIICTNDFGDIINRLDSYVGSKETTKQLSDFLDWMKEGSFIFLGCREWEIGSKSIVKIEKQDLGLFRTEDSDKAELLSDIDRDVAHLSKQKNDWHLTKSLAFSPIYKSSRLDTLVFKTGGKKSSKIVAFLGLFTSKVHTEKTNKIPIIAEKIDSLLKLENANQNSHIRKEMQAICNGIPKTDLLQYPMNTLREHVGLLLDIQRREQIKLIYHLSPIKRFISFHIVIPKERYSDAVKNRIQDHLEEELGLEKNLAEHSTSILSEPLVIINFLMPNPGCKELELNVANLEERIEELTLDWDSRLRFRLNNFFGNSLGRILHAFYKDACSNEYKASHTTREALVDIQHLEKLTDEKNISINLAEEYDVEDGNIYRLTLYKLGRKITLSEIIPFLENAGFSIIDESVTPLIKDRQTWAAIYNFKVKTFSKKTIDLKNKREQILDNLSLVLSAVAENDRFNVLLLDPGLSCHQIAVIRTISKYLVQIKRFPSVQTIQKACLKNPEVTKTLVDYFEAKFNPDIFVKDRNERIKELRKIYKQFLTQLKDVEKIEHDRILRATINVINAVARTNYVKSQQNFAVALKINCETIDEMPYPRPWMEIYQNSPEFEGVHLRGSSVSRGGIRWSERTEDYRTEVLGLMKTQMAKNAIIIPRGAKGGFIVKKVSSDITEQRKNVENCYKQFIRGLLGLTDNRLEGGIIPPEHCVIYDEEDPYLVVAADKGTATFSDTANKIAISEYNFWLGDAFASGGSNGYDHKKLGITAKGAWETTKRHFIEIGIDYSKTTFSVVGIGDMSGDVFGNGLLCSDNSKLIAAFNHQHIFLDPDPDPSSSFKERKRLFELPHSKWTDYDKRALSEGGGIFDRYQKEIILSGPIKKALGTEETKVSGDELIRIILKAPVDLLWNGGIGTYVKASTEGELEVDDRSNQDVRVDAQELRAKVFAEGGNLGITQKGRIEYSRIGGHINVDAVDNSGGVDLSDYEVNIKILLEMAIKRDALSEKDRNKLLQSVATQASDKVLSRNYSQAKTLSLAQRTSRKNLDYYADLIELLEKVNLINREDEGLPDREGLKKRAKLKAGLTRPELAILLSFSKIAIFDTILNSSIPDNPYFEKFLVNYFPETIVKKFKVDLKKHPLQKEIISSSIANRIAEMMGPGFIHRISVESGSPKDETVLALVLAAEVLNADAIYSQLEKIDTPSFSREHISSLLAVAHALETMSLWFLEHQIGAGKIEALVKDYKEPLEFLLKNTEMALNEHEQAKFKETYKQLIKNGYPEPLAKIIGSLGYVGSLLDVIDIFHSSNYELLDIAKLYSNTSLVLQIRQLIIFAEEIEINNKWEAISLDNLRADIYSSVAKITEQILNEKKSPSEESMHHFFNDRTEILEKYRENLKEFRNQTLTIPALLVIAKQLSSLSHRKAL